MKKCKILCYCIGIFVVILMIVWTFGRFGQSCWWNKYINTEFTPQFTESNFHKIRLRMTESQVISLIGKPFSIERRDKVDIHKCNQNSQLNECCCIVENENIRYCYDCSDDNYPYNQQNSWYYSRKKVRERGFAWYTAVVRFNKYTHTVEDYFIRGLD